jgi:hypothetical protein
MFKLSKEVVAEMLADDAALGTLRNQYTTDEIWDLLEDKDQIEDEEGLFNALMDVTYSTRPKGHL